VKQPRAATLQADRMCGVDKIREISYKVLANLHCDYNQRIPRLGLYAIFGT
jgi:hypothetical protein